MRAGGFENQELDCLAVACVLIYSMFLNVLMPFKTIGISVIIMYRIFAQDVIPYLGVYLTLLTCFSFAIFALFQKSDSADELETGIGLHLNKNVFAIMIELAYAAQGETQMTGLASGSNHTGLVLAFCTSWTALSGVLLANMLIARMSQSFSSDSEASNLIWIFPFARWVSAFLCKLMWVCGFVSVWRFGMECYMLPSYLLGAYTCVACLHALVACVRVCT